MKNHSIYHGLSTMSCSHRNPVTFHPQITKKSTLEPVLQLCYPKSRQNHKSDPKVGPKRVQKSIRNRSKSTSAPQGVHWVSPWTPRSPKWCPRYQKWSLNVCEMTVAGIKSDPFQQSTSQPVNQLTSQPVNQSTSPPVNQLPVDRGAGGRGRSP